MHTDYQQFTDRARKIMQLANQEAKRWRHEYVGTEHILIALAKEGTGVAAAVIKNLGLSLDRVRQEVERLMQPGPYPVTDKQVTMTPRAKNVIEFAIEEAAALKHEYVGSEHILLGLLREYDGVAAQVLFNMGISFDAARQGVLHLLGDGSAAYVVPPKPADAFVHQPSPPIREFPEPTLPPPPEFLPATHSTLIRGSLIAFLAVSLLANLILGMLLYQTSSR